MRYHEMINDLHIPYACRIAPGPAPWR
ncbi:MAG: hypothetical protein JWR07_1652, partial [Nevskia sp.]|nr:hypothetical protein [Nevskia sp.]